MAVNKPIVACTSFVLTRLVILIISTSIILRSGGTYVVPRLRPFAISPSNLSQIKAQSTPGLLSAESVASLPRVFFCGYPSRALGWPLYRVLASFAHSAGGTSPAMTGEACWENSSGTARRAGRIHRGGAQGVGDPFFHTRPNRPPLSIALSMLHLEIASVCATAPPSQG
jgi:hypothetical protein